MLSAFTETFQVYDKASIETSGLLRVIWGHHGNFRRNWICLEKLGVLISSCKMCSGGGKRGSPWDGLLRDRRVRGPGAQPPTQKRLSTFLNIKENFEFFDNFVSKFATFPRFLIILSKLSRSWPKFL